MESTTTFATPPGTFRLVEKLNAHGAEGRPLHPVPSRDPNDPLNWSTTRKVYNFGLVLAVSCAVFTALTVQINMWQLIAPELHATTAELTHSVSVNFVGLASGCALFIPLTKKYGRRSTYIVSTAVMVATSFWSASMHTVTELFITNFFQGLAGATNETIALMTVADLFFIHQRGSMNALYLSMVIAGSFLTPIASGVQSTRHGWRSVYWALGATFSLLFLLFVFTYEETKYIPTIPGLQDQPALKDARPSSHEEVDKDKVIILQRTVSRVDPSIPILSYKQRLRLITRTPESLWQLFYMPLVVLFTFPHVMYTALQYAAGVMWLTVLATILSIFMSIPPYDFKPASLGYLGLGPLIGNILGSFYAGFIGDRAIYWFAKRNNGWFEPEMRLYLLIPPALLEMGGIIMFGATIQRGMHWIYPSIAGAFFGFGLGAISDAALTIVIDAYPGLVGEAFVGVAFVRNALSIGIPFAITPWLKAMSLQNMFIICGFISLFISSLGLILVIWGKRIRILLADRYLELQKKEGVVNDRGLDMSDV